ncbi:hypothetical protein [Commensalibacter oyaizuii]|uniref:Uncharacterized protein n=1 Tax=Commensalibacter oyaizuii TaxID=3043873 RepID=A0ABT6PZ17_9PROT|nr:hypothetical protein [Commensalibacter sp. TBRC 16381]MDI2089980.1 hypothetical protein [Commensalibacter sp. TBRC 16381]
MVQKIIILVLAIVASIGVGFYIQTNNQKNTTSVKQRFKDTVHVLNDQADRFSKEVDEQKKKAFLAFKQKKDELLDHQQKELLDYH